MFERFTDRARRVLVLAQEEARLLNHSVIGTEHILLGLIHEGEGVAAKALESLGISLTAVREKVEGASTPRPKIAPSGSPPFTSRAKKVLELSLREALQLGHSDIGSGHLLLGIVREGEGKAIQALQSLGVETPQLRQRVIQLMSDHQGKERATRIAPLAAVPRSKEAEPRRVVGRRWRAEVVVAGRRPADFAAAYDQLVELAESLGLDDLDAARIYLGSVETDEGPGVLLSVTHQLPPENTGGRGRQPVSPSAGPWSTPSEPASSEPGPSEPGPSEAGSSGIGGDSGGSPEARGERTE